MNGGRREVDLSLTFWSVSEGQGGQPWVSDASFYEADILMDAILSYPWLRDKRLGVFPHLGALAQEGEPITRIFSRKFPSAKEDTSSQSEFEEDIDWAEVGEVRAMNLRLPSEVGQGEEIPLFEDEGVLEYLAKVLRSAEAAQQGIVVVPEGSNCQDPDVQSYVAALHRDFDGKVYVLGYDPIQKRDMPQGRAELFSSPEPFRRSGGNFLSLEKGSRL